MTDNPRKDRLVELSKKGSLAGSEIDEFAGLSKEFPETAAELVKPVSGVKPVAPVK